MQYGLPFRSEWVVECDGQQQAAADAAEELLRRHPNVSAIVCHQASIALGAYFGILRTGRTIGSAGVDTYLDQQVALIGFGDVPAAELHQFRLGNWLQCRAAAASAYCRGRFTTAKRHITAGVDPPRVGLIRCDQSRWLLALMPRYHRQRSGVDCD